MTEDIELVREAVQSLKEETKTHKHILVPTEAALLYGGNEDDFWFVIRFTCKYRDFCDYEKFESAKALEVTSSE